MGAPEREQSTEVEGAGEHPLGPERDVLGEISAYAGLPADAVNMLTEWLAAQAEVDRFAQLERAGHSIEERIPLARVFVDLVVSPGTGKSGAHPFLAFLHQPAAARRKQRRMEDDDPMRRLRPVPCDRVDGYTLIGGPGQGKSTLGQLLCQLHRAWLLRPRLDRLADQHQRDAVEAFTDERAVKELGRPAELRFPLRIPLAEAAAWLARREAGPDAPDAPLLLAFLKERTDCPLDPGDLLRLLDAVDWVLVLDGLDEVPPSADRGRLLDAARRLVERLIAGGRDGLILATTRPQGYAGELDDLGVELASRTLVPFDVEHALGYARRLVEARFLPARREKVLERLQQAAAGETTARLMATPLQITILATLVDRIGRAPSEQWTLFREYYRVVYEREMERPFEAAEILRLYRRYVDRIHAHVGLLLQVDTERATGTDAALSRERFRHVVEAVLTEDEIDGAKREELVRRLDRALRERLVLLVDRGQDRLGFEIRSIQEFMAAWALSQKGEALVEARIKQVVKASAFRNVVLFLASKAFTDADAGELRDAFTDRICPWMNEDPEDPLPRAALAGSELALQILEEGSGLKQDKYVRKLVTLASRLLELPPSRLQERLAFACLKDEDARQVAMPVLERAIVERLASESLTGRLGAWMALLPLQAGAEPWAVGVAESAWAGLSSQDRVALVEAASDLADDEALWPWLCLKMWEAPASFSPDWLVEGVTISRRPVPEAHAGRWEALRRVGLHDSPRIVVPIVVDGTRTPLAVRVVCVRNPVSKVGILDLLADMRDPSPEWLPWVVGARFMRAPSARMLADGLRALAEIPIEEARSPWGLELPWPLQACLVWASSPHVLREMALRAESGGLGDLDGWLSAEERWRRQGPIELTEVLSAMEGQAGYPWNESIPPFLVSERYPEYSSTWLAPIRGALLATKRRWVRELLGSLVFPGSSSTSYDPALSPDEVKVLSSLPGAATVYGPALHIEEGDRLRWAEALDMLGKSNRLFFGFGGMSRARAEALESLYIANPDLVGLLNLRWAATFSFWNFLFGVDPSRAVTAIPRHLLDLSKIHDRSARASAAGLLLSQFALTSDDIPEVADALAQAPDVADTVLVHVMQIRSQLAGTDMHEPLLLALREHAPPDAWRFSHQVDEAIRAFLSRRSSNLDDPAIWDRLHLPLPRPERRRLSSPPPLAEQARIHIESIILKNLRTFDELDLPLAAPSPDAGQWTVLLGENGTGKTTVLRSLIFALVDVTSQPNRLPRSAFETPWRRRGAGDDVAASVQVTLNGTSYGASVRGDPERAGKERLVQGTPFPASPIFAYGCRRGSALGGASRKVDIEPGAEVPTLFDEGADLVHTETWLLLREAAALREKDQDGPAARIYRAVIAALCAVLPGVRAIESRGDKIWVKGPAIGEVLLEALSDGYLTTMGWVIDLIARWVKRAEIGKDPIPPDFTRVMTGLALIDELDLHLHPEWQRRVISDVRAIFPRMSFIVTTHNPLCLLGARAEEIWKLERDHAGRIVAVQGRERPELMTSSEIYNSYFGIQSLFPSDLGEMLNHYGFLARDPVRSDEEDAEMRRLLGALRERGVEPGVQPVERESMPLYPGAAPG